MRDRLSLYFLNPTTASAATAGTPRSKSRDAFAFEGFLRHLRIAELHWIFLGQNEQMGPAVLLFAVKLEFFLFSEFYSQGLHGSVFAELQRPGGTDLHTGGLLALVGSCERTCCT